MSQGMSSIHAKSATIPVGEGKAVYVAGMIWQPLSSTSKSRSESQLRELASSFNCRLQVCLKVAGVTYAGLLQDDPVVRVGSGVNARNTYSVAAQLATLYEGQDLVFMWEIPKSSSLVLVVLSKGAPVIDSVLPRDQVLATLNRFVEEDRREEFRVLGNVGDSVEGWRAEAFSLDSVELSKAAKMAAIPANVRLLSGVVGAILLVVFGVFYTSMVLKERAMEAKLASYNVEEDIKSYKQKVNEKIVSLGMRSEHFTEHMNRLAQQPFVSDGWLLNGVQCKSGSCKSTWTSAGGYTKELVSFLSSQRPVMNDRDFKRMSFTFKDEITTSGVQSVDALVNTEWVKQYLYEEQQAWSKAGLSYKVDLQGKDLVPGFERVPKQQRVLLYQVQLNGSKEIVQNFVSEYSSLIYWQDLEIDINPNASADMVEVTAKGAVYAN